MENIVLMIFYCTYFVVGVVLILWAYFGKKNKITNNSPINRWLNSDGSWFYIILFWPVFLCADLSWNIGKWKGWIKEPEAITLKEFLKSFWSLIIGVVAVLLVVFLFKASSFIWNLISLI